MTISNKLRAILVKEFGYEKNIHYDYHIRRAEKALTTLIHKEVLAELKPLVPKMSGEEYGWWVRGKIVDRIAELTKDKEQ